MSVLLDTNIVSEIIKPTSEPRVARWLMGQPAGDIFLCAVTEAELRYGLALMPTGRRRDVLAADVQRMLSAVFAGRIWPFDSDAAAEYAVIAASRRSAGRPIAIPDAQIAAIAKSRGAALATRNLRDFEACGVEIINPWDDPA